MWYSNLMQKFSSLKLTFNTKRILNSYGIKIHQQIRDNSDTADDDEIVIWFNVQDYKWLVSKGDWADTTNEVIEDAITKFSREMYKELKQDFKEPDIEIDCELGDPGYPWFRLNCRHMIKETK